MGRRREQRVPARLGVLIRGTDRDGNSFAQDAYTMDISRRGARLEEVRCLKGPGEVIEVEYGTRKARFEVAWTADDLGEVGLRCLEPVKWSWDVRLPAPAPDDYNLRAPAPVEDASMWAGPPEPPWGGDERRQVPRYTCRGTADVRPEGSEAWLSGTVADLSEGGCYVQTMSPLPVNLGVELQLNLGGFQLSALGEVKVSHPNAGMGIAFRELKEADVERLRELIQSLAAASELIPGEAEYETAAGLEPGPDSRATRSFLELDPKSGLVALLELLENKGVITREEFKEALKKRG